MIASISNEGKIERTFSNCQYIYIYKYIFVCFQLRKCMIILTSSAGKSSVFLGGIASNSYFINFYFLCKSPSFETFLKLTRTVLHFFSYAHTNCQKHFFLTF